MDKTPRRHRRPEEIVGILEELRKSGLTQAAFSKRSGIGSSTLQLWLRKERDGKYASAQPAKDTEASKRFIPVKIVDAPVAQDLSDDPRIEFELSCGAKLRFPRSLSPDDLARYAKALGFRC